MSYIPKLRFPQFSGEWEEKNFYEVFDILQNNTFSRDQLNNENGIVRNIHYGDVLIKYGDYIDCQKEKLPFINLENNLSKYEDTSYVKNGDIIIADTAEDYTAGKVSEICNVKDYKILSGLHTFLCRTKFEFASKFLGYKLNSGSYHNQIAPLVAGTKVYSINRKAIGETTITYPSKAEQQKIADFLSNVDSIITAETKILNTLQKKKKALMQKLFTQQLRFKSDDGTDFPKWEESTLEKECDYVDYRGKTPKKVSTGIFLVTAKNIKLGYIDYECSKEYIAENDYNEVMHRGKVKLGDVLITTEAPCGNVAQIDNENVALAQRVIKYSSKGRLNNTFLKYYFLSDLFRTIINEKATGSTVKGIKGSVLHKQKVIVPSLEEQQKIADCLSSLDSLIQNQQKVVTTWQQRKKALLQQMFI